MANTETNSAGISEFRAELQAAIDALSQPRDPEKMRQAAERMDRMREELRRTKGEMEVAVDLIREVRASAP